MLAVIYVRVSTEDQARHGYSLEAQEEACRRKAAQLGVDRVEVYRDEAFTGEILERPGLQAALVAAKGVAFFIAYDPDRLSRRLAHQLLLVEMIEKAGCRLEFVTMEWQNTPEGRLFYSLRGAIAEYEKEKFKVRSRLGRLAKARRGLLPFDPRTYGYRYVEGRYEIDEARAAVYRCMVEMAMAGKSMGQIAAQLNAEGVPAPEGDKWYRQTVRRILKSPVYTGVLYVNRYDTEGHKAARQQGISTSLRLRPEQEWIPVPVPALIGREEWERLQQALAARRRGNQGGRTYDYYLAGLVYCGHCGGGMSGGYGRSSTGQIYRYYICTRAWPSVRAQRLRTPPCPGNRHRADGIEEAVWARVQEWLADPEELTKAARDEEQAELMQKEASRVRKRLAQISRERERAFEAFRRGLVDVEMFERAAREAQAEQAVLEARLRQLEDAAQAVARAEQGMETLRELATQVAGRINDLDWKDREKLIRLLVQRVTVHGDNLVIETVVQPPDRRCDIGTQTLVRVAINRSRGESIIRQQATPVALQPNPVHMVRACLPWVPAL